MSQPPIPTSPRRAPSWYGIGFFRLAYAAARFVPRPAGRLVSDVIAGFTWRRSRAGRDAVRENLHLATGLEGTALDRLCRANYRNFARMLADYFYLTRSGGAEIRALLHDWSGFEHLTAARSEKRGVILITAHLGHWELGGLLLAREGIPMNVITLPEPGNLGQWREDNRQKVGVKTITVGSDKFAFVEMMRALRANECLAMLVDRPYADSGVPVRLFGHDTEFSSAPVRLWEHTRAAVLPAFVIQHPDGRYVSMIAPPVPLDPALSREQNTQLVADAFAGIIRQHPEQWYNFVRVFKDRAPVETAD
jgi:KDO2-lipid IV(A) lauroyltransferase